MPSWEVPDSRVVVGRWVGPMLPLPQAGEVHMLLLGMAEACSLRGRRLNWA